MSEPLIRQPLHISFDARGRMWVVQYIQYPNPAGLKELSRDKVWRVAYDRKPPPPPHAADSPFRGNDVISIHEDRDRDGVFESHKVFADGLNMATSVAHGKGGIWVTNPPYLLFYPDKDQNDLPDGPPEVHLDGFGMEDTHSVANSLTPGPDGWLYGAQGSTVSAAIVRPGIDKPEDAVKSMGQHIWRYHPERRIYEIFAEGGGNAFGVDFDSKGRVYSGHNGGDTRGFHYVQGGYFQKTWGKHGALTNPYAFGYFPQMKNAKVARFTHQFIIYEGTALPEPYRGKLWAVDILHNNLVLADLIPDGSTFRTEDISRPVASRDRHFRPVHVTTGPDGNLYVADWYDEQVNHYKNHEGEIDHERGRVYRIRAKHRQPEISRPPSELESFLADYREGAVSDDGMVAAMSSKDPHVRRWAVRLTGDKRAAGEKAAARMVEMATTETDPELRSQLAASARRIQADAALEMIVRMAARDEDAGDPHIPLLVWWAMEKHCGTDADRMLALFESKAFWQHRLVQKTLAGRLMKRFAMEGTREDLKRCARLFSYAPDKDTRRMLTAAFEEAFQGKAMSGFPDELLEELAKAEGAAALLVRIRQGDPEAVKSGLEEIAKAPEKNARLIAVFGEVAVDACVPVLLRIVETSNSDNVQKACVSALGRYSDSRIPQVLLARYADFPAGTREVARSVLASRKDWSRSMLTAVEKGEIAVADFTLPLIQKLRAHGDGEITASADRLFSMPDAGGEAKEKEIERIRGIVATGGGVAKKGELIFQQRCAACHVMYGKGGRIGPDLTSYQRDNLDHLLLAIVSPAAEIREGFENTVVTMKDGAVHSGFLTGQSGDVLMLRDLAGQSVSLLRSDIAGQSTLKTSLMPEGLLGGLSDQELRDFIGYLRSTTPPY